MPSSSRFTPSINERRRSNRYYVEIPLPRSFLDEGWPAFGYVGIALRVKGHRLDKLVYLRHTVTPVGITTVFEVVP